jgi:hypothetical protein
MTADEIIDSIKNISALYKVDESLCLAIAKIESDYNEFATRYERDWRYIKDPQLCVDQMHIKGCFITLETEIELQKMSHGVFQLMGSVIRELKFWDPLQKVYQDPKIGVVLGVKKIKMLMDKYLDEYDAISAFNAGNPRKIVLNGKLQYSNQKYVDKVSMYMELLRAKKETIT